MDDPSIDPKILDYYENAWDEDQRIRNGLGGLELIRTREIIERYLPHEPCRVLDVGGAAGVHAEWLLDAGHSVDLIDPVPRHIDEANANLGAHPDFTATIGDGRQLGFEDDTYDVVLLLGPLYHLPERSDRIRSWSEGARVAKPGGLVIGAMISRFASLFSGLSEDVIFNPVFMEIVRQDLTDGQHRNVEGHDFFTTAFFHHPDEARAEPSDAGLTVEELLGVEGIAAWIPRLQRSWDDPDRREIIVEAARLIESEETLVGLGPHMLAIARAQPSDR